MEKKSILILLMAEQGAFNASFSFADSLKQRGFDITYLLNSDQYADHITKQGFLYKTLDYSNQVFINDDVENWIESLDEFSQWLDSQNCSMILLDPTMTIINYALLKLLIEKGIEIVNLNTTLSQKQTLKMPPVFSGVSPKNNRLIQTVVNALLWQKTRNEYLIRSMDLPYVDNNIIAGIKNLLNTRSIVKKVRQGFKTLGYKTIFGEYGYRLDINDLVMAPSAIDFPSKSKNEKRVFIGTSVFEQRKEWDFDWDTCDDKPIIYCSLGTYNAVYPFSQKLFSAVFELAAKRTEYQWIVQLGELINTMDCTQIPSNVIVVQNAPQLEILKKSSLFITHGGFSSVREGALYGVPMIAFPCWLDQPGNAARLEYHNIGIAGSIKSITAEILDSYLSRIEQNEFMKEPVSRMKKAFELQKRCDSGVAFVKNRVESSSPAQAN